MLAQDCAAGPQSDRGQCSLASASPGYIRHRFVQRKRVHIAAIFLQSYVMEHSTRGLTCVGKQQIAFRFAERPAAGERHGEFQLIAQNAQHMDHPARPARSSG